MKILVISDTHGRRDRVETLLRLHRGAEIVLFLGDGARDLSESLSYEGRAIAGVRGNCDAESFSDFPEELLLNLGAYTVMMTHGHCYSVKSGTDRAICRAAERGADLLLYGHTHLPEERYLPEGSMIGDLVLKKPLWVMNPGSLGKPLEGKPSYGIIEIRGEHILLSHGTL